MNPIPIRSLAYGKGTRTEVLHLDNPALSPLLDVGVCSMGLDLVRRRYLAGSDRSPTHLIYLPIKGVFSVRGGGDTAQELKPDECFLCPAGLAHWVKLSSSSATAAWVHLVPSVQLAFADAPRRLLLSRRHNALRSAIENMVEESALSSSGAPELVHTYACLTASLIRSEFITSFHPIRENYLRRLAILREAIRKNPQEAWSVRATAKKMHMSRAHLYRITCEYLHLSPHEFIARTRMQAAMEYLSREDWPLRVVAEKVGYNSEYSFSNAFLRAFGQRPGRFRARTGSRN
jgi:AraC-like DNA-binding protein